MQSCSDALMRTAFLPNPSLSSIVVRDHARLATQDGARLRAPPLYPYIVISSAEAVFDWEYEASAEKAAFRCRVESNLTGHNYYLNPA